MAFELITNHKYSYNQRKSKSISRDSQQKYIAQRSSSLSKSPQPFNKKRGKSATIQIENSDGYINTKYQKIQKKNSQEIIKFPNCSIQMRKMLKKNCLDLLNSIPKSKFQQMIERQKKQDTISKKKRKSQTPERKGHYQVQQIQNFSQLEKRSTKNVKNLAKNHIKQHNQQIKDKKLIVQKHVHQFVDQKQLSNKLNQKKKIEICKSQTKSKTKASSKQNQSTQRNSYSKNDIKTQLSAYEEKLISKFKNLQQRYTNICQSSFDMSSCVQYITDTDNDILPSFQNSNQAHFQQHQGQINQEISLNKDDKLYLREFEVIEKDLQRMHNAATTIQRVWKGYYARKRMIDEQFEQYYYRAPEIYNDDTFRSCLQQERYSQSIQKGSELSLKQLTNQTDLQFLINYESGKKNQNQVEQSHEKFIKTQKQKWQEMLNYIKQLENETQSSKLENLFDEMKQLAYQCCQDCSLSRIQPKKLEIKVPQFSQETNVLGEIKEAMISAVKNEYFLEKKENFDQSKIEPTLAIHSNYQQEQKSLFEENSFAEFTKNYMKLIKQGNLKFEQSNHQYDEIILLEQNNSQKGQKNQVTKIVPLEKWTTKKESEINKTNYNQEIEISHIKTEKEKKLCQQLSQSDQQINYSISSFTVSNQKQNEELICNQETSSNNQQEENDRLKTLTSVSQSPDVLYKFSQQKYQETIEWDDQCLGNSLSSNQQSFILLQQASIENNMEVEEAPENWLDYDEFKFYVLLDLSHLIFDQMIDELLETVFIQ